MPQYDSDWSRITRTKQAERDRVASLDLDAKMHLLADIRTRAMQLSRPAKTQQLLDRSSATSIMLFVGASQNGSQSSEGEIRIQLRGVSPAVIGMLLQGPTRSDASVHGTGTEG